MIGFYFLLLLFYTIVPPFLLFSTLRRIRKKTYGKIWDMHYFYQYIITLSFLPLLLLKNLDLGIIPRESNSILFLLLTFLLSLLGIHLAIKKRILSDYLGGTYAAFMEEILYRGIIFGLLEQLTSNIIMIIVLNAILFGLWHIKNIHFFSRNMLYYQLFYTTCIAGPLFVLARIFTGDIYFAVFLHFISNAMVRFLPSLAKKNIIFRKVWMQRMDSEL